MLDLFLDVAAGLLSVAGLIAVFRVLGGPTLPDRVVALDLIGVIVVCFAVVSAAATGSAWFLDVAIVVALVSFVGTIAYAKYIERAETS
jgi:multicomponent Na+:H+ antiporter subunit F